jgi:hypothetical protein
LLGFKILPIAYGRNRHHSDYAGDRNVYTESAREYHYCPVNVPNDGQTWITLPQGGTLWVAYEYGTEPLPSQGVFIWHQGGATENVPLGFHTFQVNPTDALVYQLGEPTAEIKLGWAYV